MQQKSALLWASHTVSSLLFGLGTPNYSVSSLPFSLCVFVCIFMTCVQDDHEGQKKLMVSLAARVTCGCELPDVGAGN